MTENIRVEIDNIDHTGRGVARLDGKTVFVAGALPLERVALRVLRRNKSFDEAEATAILRASPHRIEPECAHHADCGGCALLHVDAAAEVAYKQRVVAEQLWRIGRVRADLFLPPIYGYAQAYRERARLKVASDAHGNVVLGFQARRSHQTVALHDCAVLSPVITGHLKAWCALLQQVRELGGQMDALECAVGDDGYGVLFHARAMPSAARRVLRQQAQAWQAQGGSFWLKLGRDAVRPVCDDTRDLRYALPEFGVDFAFQAGDFTQVNRQTNALMVSRAMALLQAQAGERVADWFCGLGNFSLPAAALGANVVGFEGAATLTQRATANAQRNGLAARLEFVQADLFATNEAQLRQWGRFDKWLLDPPRDGAAALLQAITPDTAPERIVYVSCNSATLARDAAVLVGKGYRLRCIGIMNLFARTAHVECVACFEREQAT